MREAWIGAGGWSYFQGAPGPRLQAYARAFRFVELNASFYRHPSILDARRWRASVPDDFHFAVKGHRSITHGERFLATRTALSALSRDARIASALRSDILVLETPADLPFGSPEVDALKEFSAAVGGKVRIALEPRAYEGRSVPTALASAVRDVGGIDVVDLSKGHVPRVESDIVYTRLFGKGTHNAWEFSDDELQEIDSRAGSHASNRMIFAFHGVRMYKDAGRFREFESRGALVPATKVRGVRALEEVLAPDARFPTTREELLRDHGWKVVTASDGRNVHASEYLSHLPHGILGSLGETVQALERGAVGPHKDGLRRGRL